MTAFSTLCGSYECLCNCPERWEGKRLDFVGWDGIVFQLRHGKIYSPISGPDFFGRTVCVYSVWDEECVILTDQESEWPKGLMNVDMQSISLDIVIYNDTAGQCIFSDNMKQWHSVQNAEYRRRCHRQTLGMDLQKLRWKAFSFLFFFILLLPCFVFFPDIDH